MGAMAARWRSAPLKGIERVSGSRLYFDGRHWEVREQAFDDWLDLLDQRGPEADQEEAAREILLREGMIDEFFIPVKPAALSLADLRIPEPGFERPEPGSEFLDVDVDMSMPEEAGGFLDLYPQFDVEESEGE